MSLWSTDSFTYKINSNLPLLMKVQSTPTCYKQNIEGNQVMKCWLQQQNHIRWRNSHSLFLLIWEWKQLSHCAYFYQFCSPDVLPGCRCIQNWILPAASSGVWACLSFEVVSRGSHLKHIAFLANLNTMIIDIVEDRERSIC